MFQLLVVEWAALVVVLLGFGLGFGFGFTVLAVALPGWVVPGLCGLAVVVAAWCTTGFLGALGGVACGVPGDEWPSWEPEGDGGGVYVLGASLVGADWSDGMEGIAGTDGIAGFAGMLGIVGGLRLVAGATDGELVSGASCSEVIDCADAARGSKAMLVDSINARASVLR
jgi:hypothetical protein